MKVKKIKIKNIMGIEDIELDLQGTTLIEGENGSGKTSIFEAIRNVVEGGYDATLIRKGQDKGEIVLVLDNNVVIRKSITQKGAYVTTKGTQDELSPQTYINNIIDVLAANPVKIINADKKKRVDILLETIPINLDYSKLKGICKVTTELKKLNPLILLGKLKKQIYENRTGINRAVKEKKATIKQLEGTLPEEKIPENINELILEAEGEIVNLENSRDAKIELKEEGIDADLKKRDEEIRVLESKITAIQIEKNNLEKDKEVIVDKFTNEFTESIQLFENQLTKLEEQQKQKIQVDKTKEIIKEMTSKKDELEKESTDATEKLESIETIKADTLKNLPIKDVEVVDGDILVGGIPFDRLNMEKKIRIAVSLASLRAKKKDIKLVCIDGIENLDSKMFKILEGFLKKSGLQPILTKVTDGPLTSNQI